MVFGFVEELTPVSGPAVCLDESLMVVLPLRGFRGLGEMDGFRTVREIGGLRR